MKRLLLPLLAALALPPAVNAEVTYLECSLDGSLGDIEVTLNEGEREVTYMYDNGNSWTNPASFTKKAIVFGDRSEFFGRSLTIDRTNRNIFVQFTIGGDITDEQKGKCKKAEKTKTLF